MKRIAFIVFTNFSFKSIWKRNWPLIRLQFLFCQINRPNSWCCKFVDLFDSFFRSFVRFKNSTCWQRWPNMVVWGGGAVNEFVKRIKSSLITDNRTWSQSFAVFFVWFSYVNEKPQQKNSKVSLNRNIAFIFIVQYHPWFNTIQSYIGIYVLSHGSFLQMLKISA